MRRRDRHPNNITKGKWMKDLEVELARLYGATTKADWMMSDAMLVLAAYSRLKKVRAGFDYRWSTGRHITAQQDLKLVMLLGRLEDATRVCKKNVKKLGKSTVVVPGSKLKVKRVPK